MSSSGSVTKVTLVGRLGKNPDVRYIMNIDDLALNRDVQATDLMDYIDYPHDHDFRPERDDLVLHPARMFRLLQTDELVL